MKSNQAFILSVLFVILTNTVFVCGYGQSQLIFKSIDQSSGLSNERVSCIVKEKNGFVWIGTENGLNRFDGNKIKIYNKQNSTISANEISHLLIDRKGKIWIATLRGGLNLYYPSEDKFVAYKNRINDISTIPSNEINTIFEDSKGVIWLGTKNGLSFFDERKNTFKTYKFQNKNSKSISHNDVRSIYEDANEILWIGTFGGGLNRFTQKTGIFDRIKSSNNFTSDYIHSILALNKNKILIGTSGNGLITLDVNSLIFSKEKYGINENINIVRCLKRDKEGAIWIGTDGNGVFKIVNSTSVKPIAFNYIKNTQLESSISSNSIYDLMEDESSNIWLGTAWNGVNVMSFYKEYDFLPSISKGESPTSVLSVFKSKNYFYIGLDGKGLTVLQPETNAIKRYDKKWNNAIGDGYIQFINEGSNGELWIGTFLDGLINFNSKTGKTKQFKHQKGNENSLSYDDVRYVVEDDNKNLWVATWGGGINYFDTNTKIFTSYLKKTNDRYSISNDNVISLQKDGDYLWLATFGGGINHFNTKTKVFIKYRFNENNPNSISSDYVYSVLKDSRGNLWIGTAGEGINLFNKNTKQFDRFENNKNIRYQTVTAIIEDNKGLIWFSTKQGIFNYNYITKSFKSFSNLTGDFHINSCFKDEKGLLYFGSSKGVIKFNPETIKPKNITPEVKLTNFKLFNKEVPIGKNEILKNNIAFVDNIVLAHDSNVITFEFSAMKFPSAANCDYMIKLENFDKDWRSIGKDVTATYTNLSPGLYVFKVKSRDLGSDWTEKYTSVNIEILKPFWLKWWAFLIYFLLIILTFYLFRKYIVSWEKMKANLSLQKFTYEKDIELYNLKQDFFTNISHEIRTPVTLILSSINKILKNCDLQNVDLQNPINTLKKNGDFLLNLVNELLDYRKLEHNQIILNVANEDFIKFSKEIFLSYSEIANLKAIDFSFEADTLENNVWFDKIQMEKVLNNLLSNSFKFTDNGSSIDLIISETEDHVSLQIKDKGMGISKKQLSKIFNRFYQTDTKTGIGFGLGLTISKEIIALHHGEIFVESKKGVGSTFTILLKKGNSHFKSDEIGGNENNEDQIKNYFYEKPIKTQIEQSEKNLDSLISKEQTLLIVEDNIDISNYIIELFSDEYIILQAFNGKEGLKIALEKLPDLIISDVMMPIMDGIELTQYLKTNIHTSHIPIILLTARASFDHKMEGFEIGADDYVTKPFNEALLRSRIKNILKNRALLHEKFHSEETADISDLVENKRDQEFLENLSQFIEKNIESDNLSVNLLAKELGMSHSVIYKKLKTLTGLSLIEYIRDYRLKKAKRLLKNKHYSISEVCYQVGYSDRKYFSKLFKERFGNPPTFYLKDN